MATVPLLANLLGGVIAMSVDWTISVSDIIGMVGSGVVIAGALLKVAGRINSIEQTLEREVLPAMKAQAESTKEHDKAITDLVVKVAQMAVVTSLADRLNPNRLPK